MWKITTFDQNSHLGLRTRPWGLYIMFNSCLNVIIIPFRFRAVASLSLPGGQDKNISSIFPHFPLFSHIFLNFFHFLPQFGLPGGRLANPGRPWQRHCLGYCECILTMAKTKFRFSNLAFPIGYIGGWGDGGFWRPTSFFRWRICPKGVKWNTFWPWPIWN